MFKKVDWKEMDRKQAELLTTKAKQLGIDVAWILDDYANDWKNQIWLLQQLLSEGF